MDIQEAKIIAGVDEAGRGPLAGPVVAAAVILNPKYRIKGLADSKMLPEKERERLFLEIRKKALDWSVARGSVLEIDVHNILQATFFAMQRAVRRLNFSPTHAFIDGNLCPKLNCTTQAIIKGDQTEPAISAASIVAKVLRDRLMRLLDRKYPHYGFAQHKGYATPQHLEAIKQYGPCPIHRRSFAPITNYYRENETLELELAPQ